MSVCVCDCTPFVHSRHRMFPSSSSSRSVAVVDDVVLRAVCVLKCDFQFPSRRLARERRNFSRMRTHTRTQTNILTHTRSPARSTHENRSLLSTQQTHRGISHMLYTRRGSAFVSNKHTQTHTRHLSQNMFAGCGQLYV